MAAEFTKLNAEQLADGIGREPTGGELYMAHFLGAGDARRLIDLADTNPKASAAEMFPRAAQANRPVFYNRSGGERTLGEVYDLLSYRAQPAAAPETAAETAADPAGENKVASFFAALFRFSAQEGSETAAPVSSSAATPARPVAPGPRPARSAAAAGAGGMGAHGVEHRRQVSESYDLADLMKSPDRILAPRPAHTGHPGHSGHGSAQVALGGDPSMPGYAVQARQAEPGAERRRLDAHEAYGQQNSLLNALAERLGLVASA